MSDSEFQRMGFASAAEYLELDGARERAAEIASEYFAVSKQTAMKDVNKRIRDAEIAKAEAIRRFDIEINDLRRARTQINARKAAPRKAGPLQQLLDHAVASGLVELSYARKAITCGYSFDKVIADLAEAGNAKS